MARKAKRARRAARSVSSGARARKNRSDARSVQRTIQGTFNRSDLVAVGVLNLVRDTIVTAFAGAKDVGVELRGAAVAAAHGDQGRLSHQRRPRCGGSRGCPRNDHRGESDRR